MLIRKEHLIATRPAWKILASVFVPYATMNVVLKTLAPYLYPDSASHAAIFRVEAIVLMPAMLIGIGLLGVNAEKLSYPQVLARSFVTSLLASVLVAACFPMF